MERESARFCELSLSVLGMGLAKAKAGVGGGEGSGWFTRFSVESKGAAYIVAAIPSRIDGTCPTRRPRRTGRCEVETGPKSPKCD